MTHHLLPAIPFPALGPVPDWLGRATAHAHLLLAGPTGLVADVPTMQPDSGQLPGGPSSGTS